MVLMPIAEKFMNVIQPFIKQAMLWIADHMPQIKAVMDTIIKGISWVVETAGKMYNAMKPFIVSITETLGPYVKELFTWLDKHGIDLQSVLVGVAKAIGTAFTIIAAVINGIVDSITWVINNIGKALKKEGENQGGVFAPVPVASTPAKAPTPVKAPAGLSAATVAKNLAAAKALASQSLRGHASGGWVGSVSYT